MPFKPEKSGVKNLLHAVYLVCITLLLTETGFSQGAVQLGASHSILGFGFYLPNLDLMDTTKSLNSGTGIQMFDGSAVVNCIEENLEYGGGFESNSIFFEKTQQAEKVINTSISGNLSGSSKEASYKATLESQFKMSTTKEIKSRGVLIYARNLERSFLINKECTNSPKLRQEMIDDFNALPILATGPDVIYDKEFNLYSKFLNKYGSHYVAQVDTGSSLYWISTSDSSVKLEQQDYEVKACLTAEGKTPLDLGQKSISVCSGIDKESRKAASTSKITVRSIISGGTKQSRANLGTAKPITPESLNAFFSGHEVNKDGVFFRFEPVWGALKHYDEEKSNDLAAYYGLVIGFGCETATDASIIVKKFGKAFNKVKSSNEYACLRPLEGCQRDRDCHRAGLKTLCYGATCIKISRGIAKVKLKDNDTHYNEKENRTCHTAGLYDARCGRNKNQDNPLWGYWRVLKFFDPSNF